MNAPIETSRQVRSYKQRRGRIGPTRSAAIERLLPRYGVAAVGPALDLDDLFGGRPVVLDVGCGHGEATVATAADDPGTGVLAVDVHLPGLGTLLQAIEARGLRNVRVVHGDVVSLLTERVPAGGLAGTRVYFPDPWPKARHHKRRLLGPATLALLADRSAPSALLHVVTDDLHYAESAAAAAGPRWLPVAPPAGPRATTRYEAAALRAGRIPVELAFRRSDG